MDVDLALPHRDRVPLVTRLPQPGPILEMDESTEAIAGHCDSASSSGEIVHLPPASRQACGFQRLKLRARFNLQEISAVKLMAKYDRDESGALEREELLRLLTDHNDGAHPTAEDVEYILAVTGKDKGISVDEVLFALKVWYAYQHLPASVTAGLRHHHAIGAQLLSDYEMQKLLQTLNDRIFVPIEEARWVRQIALRLGASNHRATSEQLHQAIAVWYLHMEREKTDEMQLAIQTAHEMHQSMVGIAGRVIQAAENASIKSEPDLESQRSFTTTPPESPSNSYLMGGGPPFQKVQQFQSNDSMLVGCIGIVAALLGLWMVLTSIIKSSPPAECEHDLMMLLRSKGVLTFALGALVVALVWSVSSRRVAESRAKLISVLYAGFLIVLLVNILHAILGLVLVMAVSQERCASYIYVVDWWLFLGIPVSLPPVICCMCITCGVLAMAHNLAIDQGLCARGA